MDQASDIARYAMHYDHATGPQANLLDRALAQCDEKVAKAETACVRAAVAGAGLTTPSLAALVPGCRTGQVCHYDQVTHDRLGFVAADATDFVRRWRIDIDLRATAPDAAHVSITVIDRDDFDAARG